MKDKSIVTCIIIYFLGFSIVFLPESQVSTKLLYLLSPVLFLPVYIITVVFIAIFLIFIIIGSVLLIDKLINRLSI